MMRKQNITSGIKAGISLAAALALGLSTQAHAQDEQTIRWRVPSAFSTNLTGLGSPALYVAENVERASGGELQLKVFEPGKLVPAFEVLKTVSSGRAQAGYSQPIYDQGTVPALPLFGAVPYGMKPWAFSAWYFHGGGQELLKEVYANKGYEVHPILCGMTGPETAGWYREPITSLEDYEGMKIRFAGIGGRIIEKLGASVTMTPGGELFQALERGVIDATEFSQPVVDQIIGFQKVVKYNLFPGWHQPFLANYLLVNQDVWDDTADHHQALIENVCSAAALKSLAEGEAKNGKILVGLQEEGVKIQSIPEPVLKELKRVTYEVLQEEADKDDDFDRVWTSQREFMEHYSVWERRAYLPADSVDW